MIELCGMALFAIGVNRVRTAVDFPSVYVGLLATSVGIIVMAIGYVL